MEKFLLRKQDKKQFIEVSGESLRHASIEAGLKANHKGFLTFAEFISKLNKRKFKTWNGARLYNWELWLKGYCPERLMNNKYSKVKPLYS